MKWYKVLVLITLVAASLLTAPCSTPQAPVPESRTSQLTVDPLPASVFNGCPAYPFRELKSSILDKEWYALPVTSGETQGNTQDFNPLFLPFSYTCVSGQADPGQALTFPALLSFKFDYVPDNVNSSHPFFTFRKYPELLTLSPTDKTRLAEVLSAREATHAVWGELVQRGEDFRGSLHICNRQGEEIFSRRFTRDEDYFSLMGLMVGSWLEFRTQSTSPGLLNELSRPMTRRTESLTRLGELFSTPLQSEAEAELLRQILATDPDFSEVHYWYANQQGWLTGDHLQAMEEKARALTHHPVMAAVREFDPTLISSPELRSLYFRSTTYLTEILPGHPLLDYLTLKDKGAELTLAQLDMLVPRILDTPADYNQLQLLAYQYDLRLRYEKSIPLYLAALNSGYSPTDGKYDRIYAALSTNFRELGYKNEAATFSLIGLNYCQPTGRPRLLRALGYAFGDAFLFGKAALLLEESFNLEAREATLFYGYMNLYQAGETPTLLLWEQNPTYRLTNTYAALVEARNLMAKGYFAAARDSLSSLLPLTRTNPELGRETALILADLELCDGDPTAARDHSIRTWRLTPRSRRVAYLLEQSHSAHLEQLGPYAEVGSLIFSDDLYYQQLLQRVKERGYSPADDNLLLQQYNLLVAKQATLDAAAEQTFWRQQGPYAVEYLALRLVHMENPGIKEAGIRLYIAYARSLAGVSKYQRIHLRALFPLVLKSLPKIEKARWLDVLDYELAAY